MAVGALLTCVFFTTGILLKMKQNEKMRRVAKVLAVVCPLVMIVCVIACWILS